MWADWWKDIIQSQKVLATGCHCLKTASKWNYKTQMKKIIWKSTSCELQVVQICIQYSEILVRVEQWYLFLKKRWFFKRKDGQRPLLMTKSQLYNKRKRFFKKLMQIDTIGGKNQNILMIPSFYETRFHKRQELQLLYQTSHLYISNLLSSYSLGYISCEAIGPVF